MAGDKDACTKKLIDALSRARPTVKPALLQNVARGGRAGSPPGGSRRRRRREQGSSRGGRASARRMDLDRGRSRPAGTGEEFQPAGRQDRWPFAVTWRSLHCKRRLPPRDKLAICRQAAPMIQRADEKRMLLGALAAVANAGTLDLMYTVPGGSGRPARCGGDRHGDRREAAQRRAYWRGQDGVGKGREGCRRRPGGRPACRGIAEADRDEK